MTFRIVQHYETVAFDRELAVPGVDYVLSLDEHGSLARDPRLDANLHRLQLYNALLRGGDHILYPPSGTRHPVTGGSLPDGSYITRLPAESSVVLRNGRSIDPFHERVRRSAHEPIAEQVIGIYVNWLFRQAIDRKPIHDALGPAVMNDLDLRGHSAEDFLAHVYTLGLALGAVGVITDMPRVDAGSAPSREHELAMGLRPYCRIVTPQRIWQWLQDPVTGAFLWALIHEAPGLFRLWTPDAFTLIQVDTEDARRNNVKEMHTEAHGLGRVPIDMFVAKEPDDDDELAHFGVSAIASSALLQLQIDQHASLADDLQRKTNFPFLHVRDDSVDTDVQEPEPDQTLGADFMFMKEADVSWIAPPATCAQEARAHMDRLESRIYKIQGVHRRSQDSVEAHSGLALDYESSPIYATVQAWGNRLHAFETRLWQSVAHLVGKEVPLDGVSYPQDFTTRPIDLDIGQAKAVADIFGGYGAAPEWVQRGISVKIRRALERDIGHIPEAQKDLATALDEVEPPPPPSPTAPPVEDAEVSDG